MAGYQLSTGVDNATIHVEEAGPDEWKKTSILLVVGGSRVVDDRFQSGESVGRRNETVVSAPQMKVHLKHRVARGVEAGSRANLIQRQRLTGAESDEKKPVVFGYLPYWEFDYTGFQWDLLTHLAYFSAEMEADGTISDSHQWTSQGMASIMDEAQSAGVQVVLSVTNFDNEEIGTLCNDKTRNTPFETLLALVKQMGGDGVNIDFEFVPFEAKRALWPLWRN